MRGFAIVAQELLPVLGTPCEVSPAFHPASGNPRPERIEFNACWDTGASKSVITPRVVEACGLKPIRRIKRILTQGVDGLEKSEAYEINLSIPGNITIHELTVVLKNPGNVWWDVLIGMDLISQGDFSIKTLTARRSGHSAFLPRHEWNKSPNSEDQPSLSKLCARRARLSLAIIRMETILEIARLLCVNFTTR